MDETTRCPYCGLSAAEHFPEEQRYSAPARAFAILLRLYYATEEMAKAAQGPGVK